MRVATKFEAELDVVVFVPGWPDCLRKMAWLKESIAVSMVTRCLPPQLSRSRRVKGSTGSWKTTRIGQRVNDGWRKDRGWMNDNDGLACDKIIPR